MGSDNTDKCYEDLANAVITQAIDDYVKANKALMRRNRNKRLDNREKALLEAQKKSVVKFIHSEWYHALTSVPPETIEKAIRLRCRGILKKRSDPSERKKRDKK